MLGKWNESMKTQTRAAQIAAMAESKLKALGQLPEKSPKQQGEKETPEQLLRRRELARKLKSFVE